MNQQPPRKSAPRPMVLLAVLLALFSPAPLPSAEVLVFAAASLADALKEIGVEYQKATGDKIVFNLGASSVLARQIELGAPADLFYSADEAKMDALERHGRLAPGTRTNRLSNTLVIVVEASSPLRINSLSDLTNVAVKRLTMADPKAVPAGVYARQHLEKQRLWQAILPKVVPMDNVRGALAAVESGNVDAGLVYKTDAAISRRVRVIHEIPRATGPDIRYSVALVQDSRLPVVARRFLDYLNSPSSMRVFERHGFLLR